MGRVIAVYDSERSDRAIFNFDREPLSAGGLVESWHVQRFTGRKPMLGTSSELDVGNLSHRWHWKCF